MRSCFCNLPCPQDLQQNIRAPSYNDRIHPTHQGKLKPTGDGRRDLYLFRRGARNHVERIQRKDQSPYTEPICLGILHCTCQIVTLCGAVKSNAVHSGCGSNLPADLGIPRNHPPTTHPLTTHDHIKIRKSDRPQIGSEAKLQPSTPDTWNTGFRATLG